MNTTAVELLMEDANDFDPEVKNTEGVSVIDVTISKDNNKLYKLITKDGSKGMRTTFTKSNVNEKSEYSSSERVRIKHSRNSEFIRTLKPMEKMFPSIEDKKQLSG